LRTSSVLHPGWLTLASGTVAGGLGWAAGATSALAASVLGAAAARGSLCRPASTAALSPAAASAFCCWTIAWAGLLSVTGLWPGPPSVTVTVARGLLGPWSGPLSVTATVMPTAAKTASSTAMTCGMRIGEGPGPGGGEPPGPGWSGGMRILRVGGEWRGRPYGRCGHTPPAGGTHTAGTVSVPSGVVTAGGETESSAGDCGGGGEGAVEAGGDPGAPGELGLGRVGRRRAGRRGRVVAGAVEAGGRLALRGARGEVGRMIGPESSWRRCRRRRSRSRCCCRARRRRSRSSVLGVAPVTSFCRQRAVRRFAHGECATVV
jgi:hypothetical protein